MAGTFPARRRSWRRRLAFVTTACGLLGACATAAAQDSPGVRLPAGPRPPVLEGLALPDGAHALAVSPDGLRAAFATQRTSARPRDPASVIHLHGVGAPEAVLPVTERVRDLLFLEDGRLLAVVHRPARRREGDTFLTTVDVESGKLRRLLRLPPSARGVEFWAAGRSLLVPARNEIRTITLPLLRSGPLYRLPGLNLSVAVAGGTRIVVGQDAAVLLVDLSDPQQREAMPVRGRVPAPAPVVSLAVARNGRTGLAGLADGRVATLELAPLSLELSGTGVVVERATAATALSAPAAARERAAPVEPAPARPREATVPAEAAPPPPREIFPPLPAPAPPEPTGEDEPVRTPSSPAPPPGKPSSPAADPSPSGAVPDPAAQPARAGDRSAESDRRPAAREAPSAAGADSLPAPSSEPAPQIRGRLDGPGVERVRAVVAFGPNDLLREAARVRPDARGRYRFVGLAPGLYRIQLDAGGSSALITEPPFHPVVVGGQGVVTADFRVVRAM